ncbi:MBL fold metallo-hydrolase [Chelatococcus reniformis]|uniref:MBL fold metallo-hydrolase n=1 Tax=Chelatococcus reniformis TaxID=1494448 RepID=UPI0016670D8B|nr:MBL fold metallo-hydrolase [Chelatococcus reniformis]
MYVSGNNRADTLEVRFWGVRGSHPVCGSSYATFGGNTPCVEFTLGERRFVVDAGSGMGPLGLKLLEDPPERVDLLLSHLHHDHISALPFFKPVMRHTCVVRTYCGNLGGASAEAPLSRMFAPPLFPVRLDQLPGRYEHHGFHAGETLHFEDGHSVRTCLLKHPSGATGYRFDWGGHSVCYVSDIEHDDDGPPPELLAFVDGADLVIYDAMFSAEEYCNCIGWGHSTWQEGVKLCRLGNAKAMAMFHLHPLRDDQQLLAIEQELAQALPGSFVAREGQLIRFGGRQRRADLTARVSQSV